MMKTRWCALSLSFLVVTGAAAAQRSAQREKRRYVVAPRESYLLVSASQPDCPLRIEEAKLLLDVERGWGISCRLYNQGSKPIRHVSLATWSSYGTGSTFSPSGGREILIMPGQNVAFDEDDSDEIVPLTTELREKLKLQGPMKDVLVIMVERIKFADGTTYSDEAVSKALLNYFQGLDHPNYPK